MQWFRRGADENPEDFWAETARKRGGEIGFFTFATLVGRSGDALLNFPGLLYKSGDIFWFEDFERDNWLAKILSSRKKYEKTEISFPVTEVQFVRLVSRMSASRCVAGAVPPGQLAPATMLTRFFSTPVTQVGLSDGSSLFFEIMQRKEFAAQLVPATK
jgi:hypothetical protein